MTKLESEAKKEEGELIEQIRDLINEIVIKNSEQKRLIKGYKDDYSRERCLDTLARLFESERIDEGKKKKLNTRPCICLFPVDDDIILLIASNYDKTWHDKKYAEHLQEFINTKEGQEKKELINYAIDKARKTKVWAKGSGQASKASANLPPSDYDRFINAITSRSIDEVEELANNAWNSFDSEQKKENLEPLLLILDNEFIINGIIKDKIDQKIISILKTNEFVNPSDSNELLLNQPGKKMYHPDMKIIAGIQMLKKQGKNVGNNHYIALSQLCCESCYRVIKILQTEGENFDSRGTLCGKFYKNWTIPANILANEKLKELQKELKDLNDSYTKRDKIESLPISTRDLPPAFFVDTTDQYNDRVSSKIKESYNSWGVQMNNNVQNLQVVVSSQRLDSRSISLSLPYALVVVVASALMFFLFRKHRKVRK